MCRLSKARSAVVVPLPRSLRRFHGQFRAHLHPQRLFCPRRGFFRHSFAKRFSGRRGILTNVVAMVGVSVEEPFGLLFHELFAPQGKAPLAGLVADWIMRNARGSSEMAKGSVSVRPIVLLV